ncbi:hypothetical protein D3C74_437240 [compost metagenome]
MILNGAADECSFIRGDHHSLLVDDQGRILIILFIMVQPGERPFVNIDINITDRRPLLHAHNNSAHTNHIPLSHPRQK